MSNENIVKVEGSCGGEIFTLDKDTGLVTFTSRSPDSALIKRWNEALQWLPVKNISIWFLDGINYLTLELTTGEVVRLCDRYSAEGEKTFMEGNAYFSIGEW